VPSVALTLPIVAPGRSSQKRLTHALAPSTRPRWAQAAALIATTAGILGWACPGPLGPLYRLFATAGAKMGVGKTPVEHPTKRIERAQAHCPLQRLYGRSQSVMNALRPSEETPGEAEFGLSRNACSIALRPVARSSPKVKIVQPPIHSASGSFFPARSPGARSERPRQRPLPNCLTGRSHRASPRASSYGTLRERA
jgi:hypothetical protein